MDDSASFRDGLVSMLSVETDMDVVGSGIDGADGVRLALELQPDVVLMDLAMPGVDGLEATRQIVSAAPHIGVVVLTLRADDDAVVSALAAGARGYVVKGALRQEVLWAVRSVARGEAVFGPTVAGRIGQLLGAVRASTVEAPAFPELTDRECEVLRLMAAHLSNSAVARQLGISDKTVRNHVSNILTKLQARDRAEAIIRARMSGWG